MDDAKRLNCHMIVTPQDVEMLRVIRNACRAGFSYDTEEITPEAQKEWWVKNHDRVLGVLYQKPGEGWAVVGYGLLRRDMDGRWYSSVAVLPEHTGKGYGGAITAHLIRQFKAERDTSDVYASARLDNPAARALHRPDDWDVIGQDERLEYYRTKPDIWERSPRSAKLTLSLAPSVGVVP